MKSLTKNLAVFFVLVILILSIFVVVTQYQISNIVIEEDDLPLIMTISVDETSGTVPFGVNFTPLVINAKGHVNYKWDFGDGNASNEVNPYYVYEVNGTFLCNLIVRDSTGEEVSDSVEIYVKDNEAPTFQIAVKTTKFLDTSGLIRPSIPILYKMNDKMIYRLLQYLSSIWSNIPGWVHCDAQVSDPEGDDIVSYKWELELPPVTVMASQKIQTFEFEGKTISIPLLYTYRPGWYTITLTVTDSAGKTKTGFSNFEIKRSQLETFLGEIDRTKNTFQLFLWNPLLSKTFGSMIGNVLMNSIWPLVEKINSPLLQAYSKLIIIVKAFLWQIPPFDSLDGVISYSMESIKPVLDKYPLLRNTVKNFLERWEQKLEKLEDESGNLLIQTMAKFLLDYVILCLEKLGLRNLRPVISNVDPPHESPERISIYYPNVSVTVNDSEGDAFSISIHGKYINDITLNNQHNDTFTAPLITPLPYDTDIPWYVNISDPQGRWVNSTFRFKTRWEPE